MIEAHALTKRYGPVTAVDQLSFDVRPGVVTGFLWPNGSGKSTTMRLILGLDAADHGTVTVAGRVDETLHLVGLHSAGRHGAGRHGAGRHGAGRHGAAGRKAGRLSLGMAQRLGIAAALLGDPPVLILDEPVTFAGFLAGAAFVHGAVPRPALSQPLVLRAVVLSGAYLCLIGLIGLAVGVIVRHGTAAITALVALVFVAPLAGLAATPAGQYLPELIFANALGATKPVQGFTLSPWAGLAIIAAYAAVLLAVGGWLLTRRDA